MPRCFPKVPGYRIKWIQPEHMDGEQSEQIDGCCPNSSTFLPKQLDDLLEENRRGKERTPEPLPDERGQAPAGKTDSVQQANVRRLNNNNFKVHRRRKAPELTDAEVQQRKEI